MIVADLSPPRLARRLREDGLALRTGPVVTRIRTRIDEIRDGIALHYAEHPVAADDAFADFHVSVERPTGVRRWLQPQVLFRFDGEAPFAPLPGNQGFPLLEWGLNWCISNHCHQFVMIHAAVVERGGRAAILPAPPGSGKSTLCAGLMFHGWRLLSDELALIDPASGEVIPVPRPVSLKNGSIEAIRRFAPGATFGPVVRETAKGSVAHLKPPGEHVQQAQARARPAWVVLPRYVPDAEARLAPLSRGEGFMHLVDNAFNYHVHGRRGFRVLADVVEGCTCHAFSYDRLEDAVAAFDTLFASGGAAHR